MGAELAERARTKVNSRKASRRRHKKGLKKIGEGLQKELDAIVAPIGSETRCHPDKTDAPPGSLPEETIQGEEIKPRRVGGVESEGDERDKTRKKKPHSWDIIIGETD